MRRPRSLITIDSAMLVLGLIPATTPAAPEAAPTPERAAPTAQPERRVDKSTRFTIGSHNTHYGAANFHDVARVIGWQEVESTAAREKLRRQRPGYNHYFPGPGPAKAIPISWKSSLFSRQAAGYRLTHRGEARVTPNRYVTWVLLRHRDTQAEFVFLNTHFISGAFSGSHPDRRGRWYRHRNELRDLILTLKDRFPRRPVFVVGDFNRRRAVQLPHVTYIPRANASGVGLDHIYTNPGTPRPRSWLQDDYGSDHRAIIAWVKITARS